MQDGNAEIGGHTGVQFKLDGGAARWLAAPQTAHDAVCPRGVRARPRICSTRFRKRGGWPTSPPA